LDAAISNCCVWRLLLTVVKTVNNSGGVQLTTAINWYPRNIGSVAQLEAYLAALGKVAWCDGATVHHTVAPTIAQWCGLRTMQNIGAYYQSLEWFAGPHLFIAPDGIWQGTPLYSRGVHAGTCNATKIGIEVVGYYDRVAWSETTAQQVYGTLHALARWIGFNAATPNHVLGHRECNSPKTCPGTAINMNSVRTRLQYMLTPVLEVLAGVLNVRSGPGTQYPIVDKMYMRDWFTSIKAVQGEMVEGANGTQSTVWLQRADKLGFASLAWMRPIEF
jgi:hypothetical protein